MPSVPDSVLVHPWPACAALAVAELRSERALTVISVATPETPLRPAARENIRCALRELLGAFLRRPAASITLLSAPGQAITLDLAIAHIGLSVSHAAGLSVAAIHVGAAVGVDLMRTEAGTDGLPDWERVAQDYLGAQTCRRLAALAPAQRVTAFAQAWTRREAGLKCLALALTEWTPALERRLATCAVTALALPRSYCGAVATR